MTHENKWAVVCTVCHTRYTWAGPLSPISPCPHCTKAKDATADDVKEALDMVDEMESLAEEIAWDDAPDVLEKAQSIGRTIERAHSVTNGQMLALENMRDAMARWIRD